MQLGCNNLLDFRGTYWIIQFKLKLSQFLSLFLSLEMNL